MLCLREISLHDRERRHKHFEEELQANIQPRKGLYKYDLLHVPCIVNECKHQSCSQILLTNNAQQRCDPSRYILGYKS